MTTSPTTSRPLRAAGAVIGGWITLRAVMLWSTDPVALANGVVQPERPSAPPRAAALDPVAAVLVTAVRAQPIPRDGGEPPQSFRLTSKTSAVAMVPKPVEIMALGAYTSLSARVPVGPAMRASGQTPVSAPALPALPPARAQDRFQLTGWALVRGMADAGGLAPGGTLGGSQIGVRGWFEPGPRGLAITARVSAPLRVRAGAEAAIGLGYRKGNFGIIAEERFALNTSGRARPSVTAFGGVSDVRISGKLRLDGYAQAGVVGLRDPAVFADGALRIEHPITEKPLRLALGAGAWGGAQPGLARLDIGPQIVARVPVMGGSLRIGGEWRFRVAGKAAPDSGPTISIGADF